MPYTPTPLDLITPADSNHSCFEKVNQNFSDIDATLIEISSLVAGGFDYFKTALTGGTSGCLDEMDGDDLSDSDKAMVIVGNNPGRTYIYVLDADNSGAEDSPYIIAPDTNPGNKRWVLSARIPRTWKGTGTPTATDDYDDGVRNGDWWLYGGNAYMCVSETAGAAVWRIIPQIGTGATNAAAGDHNHSTNNIASTAISDWLEAVQDSAGGMWTGNTETGLSITYDDSTGKLNASVTYGADANTACQGNDSRLSDARTPVAHSFVDTTGHSASGLTTGHVLKATGATTYGFGAISASDVGAIPSTEKAAVSGVASLDANSLVVQNPANATATPTASKIPIADGSGKLDGWVSLSGKASTDHDSTHVTGGSDEIDGDKLDIDWNPANYTPTTVISYSTNVDNLTSHLKGIDDEISTINSSLGNKLESIADNSVTLAKLEDGSQGDILYYGAAGAPARLGAGTSGYYLQTKGTGANPEWAEVVGGSSTMLTGSIVAFAGASVPEGYLECNGANVSRETYADLFSAIGTTWGSGDGSTTFTLPDLRRKTMVGAGGSATDTLGNAVGNSGGAETHTLSLAELAAHDHGGATGSHDHGGATGSHNHGGTTGNTSMYVSGGGEVPSTLCGDQGGTSSSHSHTIPSGTASISPATSTISSAGSGSAHNNMQPSAVVKMVIKT